MEYLFMKITEKGKTNKDTRKIRKKPMEKAGRYNNAFLTKMKELPHASTRYKKINRAIVLFCCVMGN
jgi:hypothetical protein